MLNSKAINALPKLLTQYKKDQNYYLQIAKRLRVDFVYNTAALEGNTMTFPEVQTLLEGITVGGHRLSDEQQILNQNRSVELLFDYTTPHCQDNLFSLLFLLAPYNPTPHIRLIQPPYAHGVSSL